MKAYSLSRCNLTIANALSVCYLTRPHLIESKVRKKFLWASSFNLRFCKASVDMQLVRVSLWASSSAG